MPSPDEFVAESLAGSGDDNRKLPRYEPELAAFHRAFAEELRTLVAMVPLRATDRVLDVGCGDGFYCELLAERLAPPGGVTGLDINQALLGLARRRSAANNLSIAFIELDLAMAATQLAESFDFIWCAQSLYSFPEPVEALRAMRRIVRSGGIVAILENDTMHQLLLPWSSKMELILRSATRWTSKHRSRASFTSGGDCPP